jgi:hypothetical protein
MAAHWQQIGSKLAANGSGTELPKTLRKAIGAPTIRRIRERVSDTITDCIM